MEVLVDHADVVVDRVVRTVHADGSAVDAHLSLVGPVEAEQDVHEGALAGAVLAEQCMDLSLFDPQVHVLVGDDGVEALGDADGLECRRIVRRGLGGRVVHVRYSRL